MLPSQPRAVQACPPLNARARCYGGVSAGGSDISWPEMFDVMLGGTYRMAFVQRVLELPREERHSADAFLAAFMGTPTSMEDYARMKGRMDALTWHSHIPDDGSSS